MFLVFSHLLGDKGDLLSSKGESRQLLSGKENTMILIEGINEEEMKWRMDKKEKCVQTN